MIKFPNAKINLGLNIVAKRADGYHDISTAFYPIGLTDVLEIVPARSGSSSLTVYGRAIDCPSEKNLVMKAYRSLQSEFHLPPVEIYLHKNIPDGAGLGGGSSDASFTLIILNEIFSLNLSQQQLASRAKCLGADCPFFIYDTPMIASGIGDVLSSVNLSLNGYTLLLVKPDVYVSTAEAYSLVSPCVPLTDIAQALAAPVASWTATLHNDFEASVFPSHPILAQIKQSLISCGAVYAAMSGSGSSLFGIFESANMAEKAKTEIAIPDSFVIPL